MLPYASIFKHCGSLFCVIILNFSVSLQHVIGRCSQPLIGPNGRRSREDEKLMAAFNVKGTRGQKGT